MSLSLSVVEVSSAPHVIIKITFSEEHVVSLLQYGRDKLFGRCFPVGSCNSYDFSPNARRW